MYTSSLMFILRFFAGPIVERTPRPSAALWASGILGATGLDPAQPNTMWSLSASSPRPSTPAARRSSVADDARGRLRSTPAAGAITIGAIGGARYSRPGSWAAPGSASAAGPFTPGETSRGRARPSSSGTRGPEGEHVPHLRKTVGSTGAKVGILKFKVEQKDGQPVITDEGGDQIVKDLERPGQQERELLERDRGPGGSSWRLVGVRRQGDGRRRTSHSSPGATAFTAAAWP